MLSRVLLLGLFIFIMSQLSGVWSKEISACQNPFVRVGQKCYFVEGGSRINWFKASRRCHQLNGELVSFKNSNEREMLSNHLRKSNYGEDWPNSFWTSGSNMINEPDFYWQGTGQVVPMGLWHNGEPNRLTNENCVSIYFLNGGYFMNDAPCDIDFMFICEKPIVKPSNEQLADFLSHSISLSVTSTR